MAVLKTAILAAQQVALMKNDGRTVGRIETICWIGELTVA